MTSCHKAFIWNSWVFCADRFLLKKSVITNVDTCLLHQVLYYCPGLREGIKKLYNFSKRKDKPKDEADKSEEVGANFLSIYILFLGLLYSIVYGNCVLVIWPYFLLILYFISASTFSAVRSCIWGCTASNRAPWELQQFDNISGAAAVWLPAEPRQLQWRRTRHTAS